MRTVCVGLEAWFAFRLTAGMTSIDPSSIEIRFASPADCEALSEIGRETFTRKFGHLYSAENLSKFLVCFRQGTGEQEEWREKEWCMRVCI